MSRETTSAQQACTTRDLIVATAERLFAEHGVYSVSNRQIAEEAGQGNTAVVGYHVGGKAELVRAIARRHTRRIEGLRAARVTATSGSVQVRDWVGCLVRPTTEHLAELGSPTWFARCNAQVMTDPALREIMVDESLTAPSMVETIDGLNRCLPTLSPGVRLERGDMARQLMVHMVAERERALAEGTATPRAGWADAASGLIDAITGLWLAPVTPHS